MARASSFGTLSTSLLSAVFDVASQVHYLSSSRDSVGATAAESNRLYDEVAKDHPSTILALNHDVYGKYCDNVIPATH